MNQIVFTDRGESMFYSDTTGMTVYSALEISICLETAVCVTGHREKYIRPYKDKPENYEITCTAVKLMLERYIDLIMEKGYNTLISGLAEGADLWAAEKVLCRKRFDKSCRLIGVMPYLKHSSGFSEENLKLLQLVERYSDMLITTCDKRNMTYGKTVTSLTDPNLYKRRNYFIVDNSAVVIAFFDDDNSFSGTAQTVRYAQRLNRPVFSFGIEDIHAVIDKAGLDKTAIYEELKNIKLDIPEPETLISQSQIIL